MTRIALICSLIFRYQAEFHPTVVSYGFENATETAPASCDPPWNHLTLKNFTDLMSLVTKGFGERWMYFVVFSPSATRWFLEHGDQLEPHVTKLGYSRFVLQTNDTFEQLRDRLPERFHCLLMLVSETSVDVTADFTFCSRRRSLSQTDEVERFASKTTSLLCQEVCSAARTTKDADDAFVETLRRFLNVTSVSRLTFDPKQSYTAITKIKVDSANTRKIELILLPLFISYDRLQLTTFTVPTLFFDYELISWRQRQQMISATGLIRMFDTWSWAAIMSYAVVQVLLIAVISGDSSDAFIIVAANFLGQGVTVKNGFLWRFNFMFLQLAGFIIGVMVCNTLKAYLNIQHPIKLTTAADLYWAFGKKMVTATCVPRKENQVSTVKDPEKLEGFMGFVRDAKKVGALHEVEQAASCVPFVLSSRKHTAVLLRPKAFLLTAYERANIYVGQDNRAPQTMAHLIAPWAPHRHLIDRFFLMLLETQTFFEFKHLVRIRNAPLPASAEQPDPLKINDLFAPFGILIIGYALAALIIVIQMLKKACCKRDSSTMELSSGFRINAR